jgi:hypothetical protein
MEQSRSLSAESLVGPGEHGPHVGSIVTTIEDAEITVRLRWFTSQSCKPKCRMHSKVEKPIAAPVGNRCAHR